jgi:hypothetical protein
MLSIFIFLYFCIVSSIYGFQSKEYDLNYRPLRSLFKIFNYSHSIVVLIEYILEVKLMIILGLSQNMFMTSISKQNWAFFFVCTAYKSFIDWYDYLY